MMLAKRIACKISVPMGIAEPIRAIAGDGMRFNANVSFALEEAIRWTIWSTEDCADLPKLLSDTNTNSGGSCRTQHFSPTNALELPTIHQELNAEVSESA